MMTQTQAVYENGVLRPLQPLDLLERQCVTITITDATADVAALMDNAHFVLSADQWDAFCAVLDRPAKEIPELRKLLTQPSILDGQRNPA